MEYAYTDRQINLIIQKIISKARHELEIANENGTVDELMEEYGVTLEESALPINPRTSKILVVGELAGTKNEYIMRAKKLHIPESNIEFESNYEKLNRLNLAKLEYSDTYSDIIFGPVPHSMMGKGKDSSIITKMEKESNKYPRVTRATANGELKLSITSFSRAIRSTRYFETCA